MASNAAKTSGVETATTGVTRTTPGAPWSPWGGATCSPRPSTKAGPPARKNGTSGTEARGDAVAGVLVERRAPRLEGAVDFAAAASDEPPARPAATGMRFSSRAARAGAGQDRRPSRHRPPASRGEAAEDEVVGRRAGVEAGDVEGVAVAVDRAG